jgi:ATP-dependent DNA helicase PIF1
VVGASIKKSPLWRHFQILRLTTNMRIQTEGTSASSLAYAEWILKLGSDDAEPRDDGLLPVSPGQCLPAEDLPGVIRWAFPKLSTATDNGDDLGLGDASIIAPTNVEVEDINEATLRCYPGEEKVFASADTITEDSEMVVGVEHLNGLTTAAMPPHALRLKRGVPLLLLRNIDPAGGLCNGTRLLFVAVHGGSVMEAVIATGRHKGKRVFMPRMALYPTEGDFPFNWCRRQFPVKLAFATTINKSQGQTLGRVVVYLRQHVFGHGQLYVAASRVRGPEHIRFALPEAANCGVRNVVYREALV